jgi:hypothetical protein
LEIAHSFSLDSEFLMRNVYKNGLTGVVWTCQYCHEDHDHGRDKP